MPRLDSLTGLRWWAALAVFAHHMTNFAPLPIHGPLTLGAQGVAFFFVLSGFVLTWSARPGVSVSTFYFRRFARIWPAHMVALLLAIPVFVGPPADTDDGWVRPLSAVLLLSVVLLHGWSRDTDVVFSGNPASWTLSLEAFFYLTHPWIDRVLGRTGRRVAVGVLFALPVLAAVLYLARSEIAALQDLPRPVLRLWEFCLGMTLAHAIRLGWRPLVPVPLALGALLVVCAGIFLGPIRAPELWASLHLGPLAPVIIPTACALVICAYGTRELRGIADGSGRGAPPRWLITLGEWSYAFYLVHATVVYGCRVAFGLQPVGWINLLVYAAVLVPSIALAWALHAFVERPIEKRLRRWKDGRDQRRSGAMQVADDRGTADSRPDPKDR
jgi:peptidoglycan/LPS O-acetylase OafA/YrhL